MKLQFTDNITKHLLEVLNTQLFQASELKFAIAFAKYSGFRLLEEPIKQCLSNNGQIEFLLGLDFKTTEPKVLKILNDMATSGSNTKLFCFSDTSITNSPMYHPKLYIIKGIKNVLMSIGSANLTAGGLRDNVEINTIIEANLNEEIVSDVFGIYNKLKFQKSIFEPDINYIEEYEKVYKTVQRTNAQAFREGKLKEKIKKLFEKEKLLPKTQPSKDELYGWQRLVFERLPESIFETGYMYEFEKEFQKIYPENKHIKDKLRQILQQLRDIRLLKHVSKNKWLKI